MGWVISAILLAVLIGVLLLTKKSQPLPQRALFLVDLQNDFSTGTLAVKGASGIVPFIRYLLHQKGTVYNTVVASKDWHLEENEEHWKKWPKHCLQNTWGSEFIPGLPTECIDRVFLKGTGLVDDGYSGATEEAVRELRASGVTHIDIVGLATDYCVKATALGFEAQGFKVRVFLDGCAAVNLSEGDEGKAIREMALAGVYIVDRFVHEDTFSAD